MGVTSCLLKEEISYPFFRQLQRSAITDNCKSGCTISNIAGAEENIFAIDGNTAATAGIAEMLMQSHHDLHLLPAWPSAWPNGSIRGLRARGGFEVSLAWEAGKLTRVRISSEAGGGRAIRYANRVRAVHLERGGLSFWIAS